MCRQTNDSSQYLKKCAKYCKQCCHIFWQKNLVCRYGALVDAHLRQINWLENKMCRHTNDSYRLPGTMNWRARQKPSRRAGIIITVIKNPHGLIRWRLEPQRGWSLTVKAVCGGTLGRKDPPFNSILALPGATHQDTTHNEIIKNIITKITINQHKLYEYRNLKVIIQTLPTTNGNDLINTNTNELALTTSPSTKTGQVALRRKLRCLKKRIKCAVE